jgi:hypothetical protein
VVNDKEDLVSCIRKITIFVPRDQMGAYMRIMRGVHNAMELRKFSIIGLVLYAIYFVVGALVDSPGLKLTAVAIIVIACTSEAISTYMLRKSFKQLDNIHREIERRFHDQQNDQQK